jgi:hypothetical protein
MQASELPPEGQGPPSGDDETWSHIWLSEDRDEPCTPTGSEWRDDKDGRIYAEVRREGGTSTVPKDGLVPAAAATIRVTTTFFGNYAATTKREEVCTLAALAVRIRTITKPEKAQLPWLKLARFGALTSDKSSLRHDANVEAVTGIEADYDGRKVSFDEAADTLTKAGILALLYTSPSHSPAAPRWRVLCPLSTELPPDRRGAMLGRLNGLFGGIFSAESWTLSQAYYFGSVNHNPAHRVVVIDGTPLDEHDELDEIWIGKRAQRGDGEDNAPHGGADLSELLRDIVSGKAFHTSVVSAAGYFAVRSVPIEAAVAVIHAAFDAVPAPEREARWQARRDDTERCIRDIYRKEAAKPDPEPPPGWEAQHPSHEENEGPSSDRATNPQPEPEPPPAAIDTTVLRLTRRAPPAFPLAIFGAAWKVWIENAAQAACCPVDYVAAPLLAVTSALIGNARWAQAWHGWEEPPHLWLSSVGDSGDGKTPGENTLFAKIVPELDRRMVGDFPQRHAEWKAAVEAAEARKANRKDKIKAALKKKEAIAPPSAEPEPGDEPQEPRLVMRDVTVEKIAVVLASAAPKGVLMMRDELAGFLLGMNAYNDAARPFWLEAWNGHEYRVDRVKHPEPVRILHNVVAWFGTIQPERLAQVMAEADDGLLARFIWCWPDPIPFDRPHTVPDTAFATRALDRLRQLEMHRNSDGTLTPNTVPLVNAAQPRMEEFGREMQRRRDLAAGLHRSSFGKARGVALRAALVFELLWWSARDGYDPPPIVISDAALEAATHWARYYVMPMAERTFGDAAASREDRNITILAHWIAQERPSEVHVRTLQREVRLPGLKDAEAIHAACHGLVDAGWLLVGTRPHGKDRNRAAYPVNPALWEALS